MAEGGVDGIEVTDAMVATSDGTAVTDAMTTATKEARKAAKKASKAKAAAALRGDDEIPMERCTH